MEKVGERRDEMAAKSRVNKIARKREKEVKRERERERESAEGKGKTWLNNNAHSSLFEARTNAKAEIANNWTVIVDHSRSYSKVYSKAAVLTQLAPLIYF